MKMCLMILHVSLSAPHLPLSCAPQFENWPSPNKPLPNFCRFSYLTKHQLTNIRMCLLFILWVYFLSKVDFLFTFLTEGHNGVNGDHQAF